MGRLVVALFLYVGLGFFFAVNAIGVLRGVSVTTAVVRGLVALALFAALGVVASLVLSLRSDQSMGSEE